MRMDKLRVFLGDTDRAPRVLADTCMLIMAVSSLMGVAAIVFLH